MSKRTVETTVETTKGNGSEVKSFGQLIEIWREVNRRGYYGLGNWIGGVGNKLGETLDYGALELYMKGGKVEGDSLSARLVENGRVIGEYIESKTINLMRIDDYLEVNGEVYE